MPRPKGTREMPGHTKRGWMMGRGGKKLLASLSLFALAACQDSLRSTATGAASNVPAHPPSDAAPPASRAASSLVGTWLSTSCGERAYPRLITFEADGSFAAEDRVSPCPPGARCVWSGIVHRTGTYTVEGETVRLQTEPSQQQKPGVAFPERLRLVPGPVERLVEEAGTDADCVYSKQS